MRGFVSLIVLLITVAVGATMIETGMFETGMIETGTSSEAQPNTARSNTTQPRPNPASEAFNSNRVVSYSAGDGSAPWVRTSQGWERLTLAAPPERWFPSLHPAIVASFVLLGSLMALAMPVPPKSEPNPQ